MAEKTEKKGGIERLYTINLRKEWLKAPLPKRSKRTVRTVRNFVTKHTKSKDIKLSKGVNELILKRGFKKPPGKITVEVKGDMEEVTVRLPGEVMVMKEEKKPSKGIAGLKERLLAEKGQQGAAPVTKKDLKETIKKKVEEETTEEKVKEIAERVKKEKPPEESKKKEEKPAEKPKEEEKKLEGKKADKKEPEKTKKKEEKPSKEEKK